jgi:hypothetical protein
MLHDGDSKFKVQPLKISGFAATQTFKIRRFTVADADYEPSGQNFNLN